MANPFEEPFAKPKQRKPGVAPLVGDVFGPGAQKAMEKVTGGKKERPTALAPSEDWEGGDITMSAVEREKMQIEKDHVRLQGIPIFTELPDGDDIKKDFNFDSVWYTEYQQDRPLTDFALTDADLVEIDLDERTRVRIMEAMSKAKESLPLAKVFDIAEIIRQKQQADPEHPDYLTTKEVLESIDASGYRPATLQELLVYGRDHWRPDVDPGDLSDKEVERLQFAYASYIYAIAAPFSMYDGSRFVPCLAWGDMKRFLNAGGFNHSWRSGDRFLVLRKAS